MMTASLVDVTELVALLNPLQMYLPPSETLKNQFKLLCTDIQMRYVSRGDILSLQDPSQNRSVSHCPLLV